MYARACQLANASDDRSELLRETQAMRGVLEELLSSIYAHNNSSEGQGAESSIWVSPDESEAVSSALAPKLRQAAEGVERLLFEVVTLEVSLFRAISLRLLEPAPTVRKAPEAAEQLVLAHVQLHSPPLIHQACFPVLASLIL